MGTRPTKVVGWAAITPRGTLIGHTIRKSEEEAIKALTSQVSGTWGELLERGWDVKRIHMDITIAAAATEGKD